ncbi:major facilitator superfamily domain-containing protein [Helicostylum pulchrum]|nr:major facilitator superfamily domain-containing protein [Helicostylum pulchrum]
MKFSLPLYKSDRKPIFLNFRSSSTYVLVTVSIAMFVNMLAYSLIVPIVPFIVDALNRGLPVDSGIPYDSHVQDDAETSKKTGIMLAFFAVGLLIGSPIFGYMGDRITKRKIPMLMGIGGMIIATLLFLFIDKYYQFLIARALQGFADASVWTLGMAMVADAYPVEQLGRQMSKVLLSYSIGLVAGAPIGGGLYQHFGYKAPFIFVIVLAGVDFILRLLMIEKSDYLPEWLENEEKEESVKDETIINEEATIGQDNETCSSTISTSNAEPPVKGRVSTWTLISNPRLIAAALLAFANGVIYNVFEPTLTVKLSKEFGLNASQIGLVFLAQMIPTFVSTPLSGWIHDRYGPKIVCITTMPLCALFMILMGTQNQDSPGGVAPLIVLFALQGFTAFAFLTPALPEIAHVAQVEGGKVGDSGTGRSFSIFNMAFGVGALIGPLLGGFLYGEIGFFYLCVVMACFLIICVPYIYFFIGEPGKIIDYRGVAAKK